MTGKARQISEANLHERLAVVGPNDELKDLGDTFDGLLARLDGRVRRRRKRFRGQPHRTSLRTPLTLQRAMLEVALADPNGGHRHATRGVPTGAEHWRGAGADDRSPPDLGTQPSAAWTCAGRWTWAAVVTDVLAA